MELLIQKAEEFVHNELGKDSSGHDWFHIDRVRKLANYIRQKEDAGDAFIIEMAALLHDITDEKLNDTREIGEQKLHDFLLSIPLTEIQRKHIEEIIQTISFKGGNESELQSIEARIVRDADRLDAIGAIGIARTFAYGGKAGSPVYNPEAGVRVRMSVEEYRNGKSSSIHHFYEKLLLLKDRMHTKTAKELAEQRHQFMGDFLSQFYKEWNGQYEVSDS
ncbi:HD domain-containing protein [Heyndrickxia acidicola]|uniref:HD domain-containing protein n=1 Tax=Heyndrickxia acidicola TaxID=209389 RepID=A0ABU6ML06_9BACI|nr:HD domain-containing protein [Heyndrickxia acidicola]MED1205366.1 HD domain-containing protein [Heyndrickxia acidicola]